jgi:hypothetical protein
MKPLAAILAALALAGCVKYPEPYRPPIQRRPMELTESGKLRHFIHMNAPDAANHIVTDVMQELNDGAWRWTLKSPTLQFQLPSTQSMRLRADLTIADITFEQTGPVKISVHVGGRLLDTIDCAKPGQRTWEKAVPPEWLTTGSPVLVRMEIDKIWTSPSDGAQRGFILTRIGFVQ